MKNILVFKTSVINSGQSSMLEPLLNNLLNKSEKWNFDLDDCDHILRVEAPLLKAVQVIEILNMLGFDCVELEDTISVIELT